MTDLDRGVLRLIALPGSLRASSSNLLLLQAATELAPEDMSIELASAGELPHFNPDFETANNLPPAASAWRSRVSGCDGLLLSCPEYAGGIPGTFKNALDWLVGDVSFQGKPVAIFNASPRSISAQAALRLVLLTMSAHVVEEASLTLPLLRSSSAANLMREPVVVEAIRQGLLAFKKHIVSRGTGKAS